MVLINNYTFAIILCFIAMVCWGSWQSTQNLTGKSWRFELYYWDFSLGILIFSLLMALTFGSFGESGRSFIPDLAQAKFSNLLSAAFGGVIWNLGTLLLVAAISVAGMSVAFPIGGGIGWLLGIFINYLARPEGNPYFILSGSTFILIAIILSMLSYRKLATQQQKPTLKGIVLSVAAGLCIAFFYKFVAASLATDFSEADAGKISSYTAVVLFSIGAFICTLILNPVFMAKPIQGEPVKMSNYFKGTKTTHFYGMLGGAIWCFGNSVSFMAVKAAGPAISYALSNSAPLVAAIWGIFVWKEFKEAPKNTSILIAFMFVCYIAGLVLITLSNN